MIHEHVGVVTDEEMDTAVVVVNGIDDRLGECVGIGATADPTRQERVRRLVEGAVGRCTAGPGGFLDDARCDSELLP